MCICARNEEISFRPPLIKIRQNLRRVLSYRSADVLGEYFVKTIPQYVQRWSENKFDFPIPKIVRDSPVLLIRVPRTASVSLALQIYGQVHSIPHRTAAFYYRSDPSLYNSKVSFAVVRDPITRIQSAYRWLKNSGTDFAAPNPKSRRLISEIRSFDAFVMDYVFPASQAGSLKALDPTLHLQSDYVCNSKGKIMVNHIFRYEQFTQVQDFLLHCGITSPERKENSAEKRHEVSTFVRPEINEAIRLVYQRDFEMFYYET